MKQDDARESGEPSLWSGAPTGSSHQHHLVQARAASCFTAADGGNGDASVWLIAQIMNGQGPRRLPRGVHSLGPRTHMACIRDGRWLRESEEKYAIHA